MQHTVTMHGINFEVEFTPGPFGADVDEIYIGGAEVTDVLSEETKQAIEAYVESNADRWAEEYNQHMRDEAEIAAAEHDRYAAC